MSTLAGNQVVIQLPAKEIQLLLLLPLFSSSKAYKKVLFHQCHFFCKHRFVRTPAHHLHHRGCHTDWFLLSSQQYRLWHFDQSFKVPDARAYVKSSKRKEVQLVFLSLLIIHFQSNKRLCIKKEEDNIRLCTAAAEYVCEAFRRNQDFCIDSSYNVVWY